MPYREKRLPLAGIWQNNIIGNPCSAFEMLSKRINIASPSLIAQPSINEKNEIISPGNLMTSGEGLAAVGAGDGPCHCKPGDGDEAVDDEGQSAVSLELSSNTASESLDAESCSDQGSTITMNNFNSYVLLQDTKKQPDSISTSRFPPVSPGKYDHVKSKVLLYIKGNQLHNKK